MKILGLDSSGIVASVAIVEDENLIAEYTVNYKKTHSQTLLPMLDELVKMTELDLDTIDAIAVAAGPGSFTGLRIGSATAKGLGLALKKPLVEIPTVDALAYNLYSSQYVICPIMDARRGQVYTGIYKFEETEMKTIKPQCIMMIDELIKELDTIKESVMFLGDGVDVHKQLIDDIMDTKHYYAPASMNRHKASTLGTIAEIYYKNGKTETAKEHKPEYLRLSQAERELKAKMKEAKSDN